MNTIDDNKRKAIADALRTIASGMQSLAQAIEPDEIDTGKYRRSRHPEGRYYRILAEPIRQTGGNRAYRQISEVWGVDAKEAISKEARHITECGLPWNTKTLKAEPV